MKEHYLAYGAFTSVIFVVLVLGLRACENESYRACLAKASEISQCKDLQP